MANETVVNAKVVIIGAGFAGLGAAKKLEKAAAQITLIDKNDYHTFQPLLYQVATALLEDSEVGHPVRDMVRGQENLCFHKTAVTSIDLQQRQVHLADMDSISYDYLVLCPGATVNFFGISGADEHAFPLYTLPDAVRLKRHVLQIFDKADKDRSLVDEGALNIVVVGGGPTGVETAGAMAELFENELALDYPHLPVSEAQITLVEAGPVLLSPFKKKLQAYTKKELEERGVHVRLGEVVEAISPDEVTLKSGEVLKTKTLVWGAGIKSNPLIESLGVELVHGRIPVEADLTMKAHPEVFVIGDGAAITDGKTGQLLPQLGSVALQSGNHAGETIARLLAGKSAEPFKYLDKGFMATIGHGSAVMQVHNRTMTGEKAWLAWGGVHLALLSGMDSRSSTIVDWGWSTFTHKRGKRTVVDLDD